MALLERPLLWEYDDGMTTKVRKTLTLDADLVEHFGAGEANLSAAVNEVLAAAHDRARKRASLRQLIDDLVAIHGEPDAELMAELAKDWE
jgi:post-segregation antitoxin (ccd killing protein)